MLLFTFFFPLFSPFLHNLLSAHSSSSSKCRSGRKKILYRQSALLMFFDCQLFMRFAYKLQYWEQRPKLYEKGTVSIKEYSLFNIGYISSFHHYEILFRICNFMSGPQQLQPEVTFTLDSLSVLGKLYRTSSLCYFLLERPYEIRIKS
jgi:hypothetical protein